MTEEQSPGAPAPNGARPPGALQGGLPKPPARLTQQQRPEHQISRIQQQQQRQQQQQQ